MSLYEDWNTLMKNQTESTFESFWKEYADAEIAIYSRILSRRDEKLSGTVKDLSQEFNCRTVIFTGFLDGVKSSLTDPESLDPENVTEDSNVSIEVDFEKLYYNMQAAEAKHLYSLPEWDEIYTEEERSAITKKYKQSKIYHPEKKPGRNDPCPCGSGKKYKKCCGKSA